MEHTSNKTPEITVTDFLKKGTEELELKVLAGHEGLNRKIRENTINRPGLALAGFFDYFPSGRIQLIGFAEYSFIMTFPPEERYKRMERIFSHEVPCVVYARGRTPNPNAYTLADKYKVPLLSTPMETRRFSNAYTLFMEELLAPTKIIHATFLEVDGMGVVIEGDAGIGKSETALGLIKRGHALVADDFTILKRTSNGKIIGSARPVTRYFMEIRGVGIIYVPAVFGVSAVRGDKQVDIIITLDKTESTSDGSVFDRVGNSYETRDVLGIQIPHIKIPVAAGRDIVNVVETAAQEFKLKKMNVNASEILDERMKQHAMGHDTSKDNPYFGV